MRDPRFAMWRDGATVVRPGLTVPRVRSRSADPFTRKDWYDIKAPAIFQTRQVGKTMVNRTAGTSALFWP